MAVWTWPKLCCKSWGSFGLPDSNSKSQKKKKKHGQGWSRLGMTTFFYSSSILTPRRFSYNKYRLSEDSLALFGGFRIYPIELLRSRLVTLSVFKSFLQVRSQRHLSHGCLEKGKNHLTSDTFKFTENCSNRYLCVLS